MFQMRCREASRPREPSLDEILAEPIVRRLMERDGADEAGLRRLADEVRERLEARQLAGAK
jgi:hypothetical protein